MTGLHALNSEVERALLPLKHPRARLSLAASELWQLANDHAEAAHYDALFDGGEWSSAQHCEDEAKEQNEIARRYGFKGASALYDEIEKRTSARWMHFNFPPLIYEDDEFERDPIHGRRANR